MVSGHCPALHHCFSPIPPPPHLGVRVVWNVRSTPPNNTPPPTKGVEGPRRASSDQMTLSQPCPPTSPSGVAGRSSRRAGSQQVHSPLQCSPSRTAPTWADIVRGDDFTQQKAPAALPDDAIALYKRYVALDYQARFSVKSSAGYQEVSLFCCFPVLPAASCLSSHPHTNRRCQCRRNCHRNHRKAATHTISAQTKPPASTRLPPRPHRPASPSPPAQACSPTAPPPAKRTQKRRCELELLREDSNSQNQYLPITPPTIQPRSPPPRSPSPSSLPSSPPPSSSSSLQFSPPHLPWFPLAALPLESTTPSSPPPSPPSSPSSPPSSPLPEPAPASELEPARACPSQPPRLSLGHCPSRLRHLYHRRCWSIYLRNHSKLYVVFALDTVTTSGTDNALTATKEPITISGYNNDTIAE